MLIHGSQYLISIIYRLPINFSPRLLNYNMPRYVAKEDVEKGLVDPNRPLAQQLQYRQKIEKQTPGKQKQQQHKNSQQRHKKQRPPRKQRPKYNWNKNAITLETKIPQKPKIIIEKPDIQKHRVGLEKLKSERELLKQQRQALFQQQRAILRDLNESKKNGKEAISQYSGEMRDKFNFQNQLRKQIRYLDDHKKKINFEIENLSYQLQQIRRPSTHESCSIQYLNSIIENKEHQLMTANIGKREETKITSEINQLKRALVKARPYYELESQAFKLEDQINLLYLQLKPIKHELHIKITEANKIRSELEYLKEQKRQTQGHIKVPKTAEQIKAEYDLKFKAIQDQRDKLEDRIDDYVDEFVRENDEYDDQQDLLNYIEWVEDQIAWLKKKKQQEQLRKKEQQQREVRRQKEKEEYQKRQEQRKKQDQQRRVKDEARKKRLQQEREKYLNRNPNQQFIDLSEALVDYCEGLKPSKLHKYEDPRAKQAAQLNFGKEWQKEIKGGAQVIQSKKSKLEEQAPKKQTKPKKKQQKTENEDFTHGIEIVNKFQSIKLLPPNNVSEIDSTIKLIKEKLSFYSNPTEEQRAAFRQRAGKQFDERNAPRERRQGKQFRQKNQDSGHYQQNQKRTHLKKEKKQLKQQDFPGIT